MLFKFFIFSFSLYSYADTLRPSISYHANSNLPNALKAGSLYDFKISVLETQLGGRLVFDTTALQSLHYKAEIGVSPLPFLNFSSRLSHAYYFEETSSLTHIAVLAKLEYLILGRVGPYLQGGWFKRLVQLNKSVVVPTFRNSYSEHDFAADLGFIIVPLDQHSFNLHIATFDSYEIYNFNNPFAEIKWRYSPSDTNWKASLIGRYKILLGFGRLNEVSFGIELEKTI